VTGPESRSQFFGRKDALDTLQETFQAAVDGRGGLVLLSGEPGIGKTCCAEQFARRAAAQGAQVLWGRCYEQPGAPPCWPWVQILRGHADASSDDELRLWLGASAEFEVFDAIGRVFARASASAPHVVIIDDLHWADPSSLSLLEYLAKEARRLRLLTICCYRDMEVTRQNPLLLTLGELTHGDRVERVRLNGLSACDTAELTAAITGLRLPPSVLQAVFQQTNGNPLFVREVAKVIAEEHRAAGGGTITIAVPDGIREATWRRLDRLAPVCSELLVTASVVGREFDLKAVAGAMGVEFHISLGAVDGAVQAGLVRHVESGIFRFAHPLIRETLYEELPTLRRFELHERLAMTLIDIHAGDLDPVLSEIVHHLCAASALGNHETAVALAVRAAERDERLSAFAEACRHYDDALGVLTASGRQDDPRRAPILLRKGVMCLYAGMIRQSTESLTQGIALARRQRDPELFGSFVTTLIRSTSYAGQDHAVPLLEEALRLLPKDCTSGRAVMLGQRAFALRSRGDIAQVRAAAAEAIGMARTLDDPLAHAMALRFSLLGLRGWAETLSERLEYGREMLLAMARVDDPEEWAECCYFHLLDLIDAGDTTAAAALLRRYGESASRHQFSRHQYQASLLTIVMSLLRGNWNEAEPAIEAAVEQGQRLIGPDTRANAEGVYGAQMFVLNRDLGRLRGLAPTVRAMIDAGQSHLWAPGLLLLCCELGIMDHARRLLDELAHNDFRDLPRDDLWSVCASFCAEACARLHDANRAALLYELLMPYASQTIHHPTAVCFGSASSCLGLLAETMGQAEVARAHYEYAIDVNRAMGAWPALARTQLWLGRMLSCGNTAREVARGRQILVDAEQLAIRSSMAGLSAEIQALLSGNSAHLPDGLTPREAEVIKLLASGRSNKDIARVLAISLSTVATHVRSILSKSCCANRTEAAAYAIRHKLTWQPARILTWRSSSSNGIRQSKCRPKQRPYTPSPKSPKRVE
jgi:ATP/maltotriose-dependent transcriptional regulator MalT